MRDRSLWTFMLCGFLLAVPGIIGVLRLDHLALHMAVNRFHTPFLDDFFLFVTELANGWVPATLALLLILKSWRAFLMMGLSTLVSAVLVQTLKHAVFSDVDRPSMFLSGMPGLSLVKGLDMHHYFSFPSGHSTAAFAMCLALAVIIGKRTPAALLALFAALLAYSRVYLSQHFTEDALAGALLGSVTGVGVYFLLYKGRFAARKALDLSPFRHQNQ